MRKFVLMLMLLCSFYVTAASGADTQFYVVAAEADKANFTGPWKTTTYVGFTGLQNALAAAKAAATGDVPIDVYVAAGTYDVTATLELPAKVMLYGGFAGAGSPGVQDWKTNETILKGNITDGDEQSVIKCVDKTATLNNTRLDGFTITGGKGTLLSKDEFKAYSSYNSFVGGGMCIKTNLTVANCSFTDNEVTAQKTGTYNKNLYSNIGGGMFISGDARVFNCTFDSNTAGSHGGGIAAKGSPVIEKCTFTENKTISGDGGTGGGGIAIVSRTDFGDDSIYNSPIIKDCTFSKNVSQHRAGGVLIHQGTKYAKIENCLFEENKCIESGGGGIAFWGETSGDICNCTFINNVATNNQGGGVYLWGDNGEGAPVVTAKNCTFMNNKSTNGAGMYIYGHNGTDKGGKCKATVVNCIFINNDGSEFYVRLNEDQCVVVNSIILNSSGKISNSEQSTQPTSQDCVIYSGETVTNWLNTNLTQDTVTVEGVTHTVYKINASASDLINHGTTAEFDDAAGNKQKAPNFDQLGATRDNQPDIGAYEYQGLRITTDSNMPNGVVQTAPDALKAEGSGSLSWSATGLDSGLSLNSDGSFSAPSTSKEYSFKATVTGGSLSNEKNMNVAILPLVNIESSVSGNLGESLSAAIASYEGEDDNIIIEHDAPDTMTITKSNKKITLTWENPTEGSKDITLAVTGIVKRSDNSKVWSYTTKKVQVGITAADDGEEEQSETEAILVISSDATASEILSAIDQMDDEQKASFTGISINNNSEIEDISEILTQLPNLKSVDVSNSSALKTVDLTSCENLTEFNAQNCTSLAEIDATNCSTLETLDCSGGSVEKISVQGCENLKDLSCQNNNLESLDVSGCTNLTSLDCSANNIGDLKVDGCENLESLNCGANSLSSLNVTSCRRLQVLYCYSNNLTELNVQYSERLYILVCDDNSLNTLNVEQNKLLRRLDCQNNAMPALDITSSVFAQLQRLKCYGQSLSGLNVTSSGGIYSFNLRNYIQSSIQSKTFSAASLNANNDDLNNFYSSSSIDNVDETSIKAYDADGNAIEVTGYTSGVISFASKPAQIVYDYDTGYNNTMMDVTISEKTQRNGGTTVGTKTSGGGGSGGCDAGFGIFSALIILAGFLGIKASKKKFLALFILSLIPMFSSVASADVAINSANFPDEIFRAYVSTSADTNGDGTLSDAEISAVTIIDVNTSGISSLKGIENFSALVELYCYANNLTTLDVSSNKKLQVLECDNNQLTSLNLSQNSELRELECELNYIRTLDLSKNTKLYYVKCYSQTISDVKVTSSDEIFYVDLGNYAGTSNLCKILSGDNDITGENSSGDVIYYQSYDDTLGVVGFSEYPYSVTYKYETGYYESANKEMTMDVTLVTVGDVGSQKIVRTSGGGGSSSGCNAMDGTKSFILFAIFVLVFNFYFRKRAVK